MFRVVFCVEYWHKHINKYCLFIYPAEDNTSMSQEPSFIEWFKSVKALSLLQPELLEYVRKKMDSCHKETRASYCQIPGGRNEPCQNCSHKEKSSPCYTQCVTWTSCVEDKVRCRGSPKIEWCGRKFQQSFKQWEHFAILFIGSGYKKHSDPNNIAYGLDKVDAYGLLTLMKHCEAFKDVDFNDNDYQQVKDNNMDKGRNALFCLNSLCLKITAR